MHVLRQCRALNSRRCTKLQGHGIQAPFLPNGSTTTFENITLHQLVHQYPRPQMPRNATPCHRRCKQAVGVLQPFSGPRPQTVCTRWSARQRGRQSPRPVPTNELLKGVWGISSAAPHALSSLLTPLRHEGGRGATRSAHMSCLGNGNTRPLCGIFVVKLSDGGPPPGRRGAKRKAKISLRWVALILMRGFNHKLVAGLLIITAFSRCLPPPKGGEGIPQHPPKGNTRLHCVP